MFYMNDMGEPSQENFESMEYLNDNNDKKLVIRYQTIYRFILFLIILGISLFFLKKKNIIHI